MLGKRETINLLTLLLNHKPGADHEKGESIKMEKGGKRKKRSKKAKAIIWGLVAVLIITLLLVGWFAPVNDFTPLWVAASRPEFRGFGHQLLIEDGWTRLGIAMGFPLEYPLFGWNCDGIKYGLNTLSEAAKSGETVYYDIYTQEEMETDPSLRQTGLFVLRADTNEKKPFVLMCAGGGYEGVCSVPESLPVISAFSNKGYTSFALIYRYGENAEPRTNCDEDVARAIQFIIDHADEFNVEVEDYLIGGFSAGGDLVGRWGTSELGYAKYNLPKPGAICLIYGNHTPIDENYPPCYMLHAGNSDAPARFDDIKAELDAYGIDYAYKSVAADHGFGLGLRTPAEGWINEAEQFWLEQIQNG